MGSWNGTCGITQLPIIRGDKVVVFPLMRNLYGKYEGGGVVQPDNYYAPITLPFEGRYDDHGGVTEIIDSDNASFNHLSYILGNKIENMEDSNENIQDLAKNIERGKFEDVGFMLVHDKIYREIIKEIGNRNMLRKNPENNVETLRELCNRESFELFEMLKMENIHTVSLERSNSFFRLLRKESFLYYVEHFNKEENQKVHYGLINFVIFYKSMEALRKLWIIQSGAGSQDEEFFVPKLIAEFVIEKEEELHEEYKEISTDYEEAKNLIGKTTIW